MTGWDTLLFRLNRIPGVQGSLVVDVQDGLLIDSDLLPDVPGEALAALVARLFDRARSALEVVADAPLTWLQLSAERGYLFAAAPESGGDLLLIVAANENVNIGQLRLEATRLAGELP